MIPVYTNYRICQDLNKSGVHSEDSLIVDILCWIFIILCYSLLFFVIGIVSYSLYKTYIA